MSNIKAFKNFKSYSPPAIPSILNICIKIIYVYNIQTCSIMKLLTGLLGCFLFICYLQKPSLAAPTHVKRDQEYRNALLDTHEMPWELIYCRWYYSLLPKMYVMFTYYSGWVMKKLTSCSGLNLLNVILDDVAKWLDYIQLVTIELLLCTVATMH